MMYKIDSVILTADRGDDPWSDAIAEHQLYLAVHRRGFLSRNGIGYFEGQKENILQVFRPSNTALTDFLSTMLRLGDDFEQDSILLVRDSGHTTIHFTNSPDAIEHLGQFRQVDAISAKLLPAWSYLGGEFYSTEFRD